MMGKSISPRASLKEIGNKIIPLNSGPQLLGAINLIFPQSYYQAEAQKGEFIDALVSSFVVALVGLQSLIRAQESKTESLVYSLKSGIVMLNAKKEVVMTNPAALELIGVGGTGENFDKLFHLVPHRQLERLIDVALRKGVGGTVGEVKRGHKYLSITVTPVINYENQIEGAAVIIRDITEARRIAQMKSEFVSVASHQLRTPLTAIKLFSEMLYDEQVGRLTKRQKEYLSNIHKSIERMTQLVNDLLNVTRIESGRLRIIPEPVSLVNFIKSVLAEAKPLAEQKGCILRFVKKVSADKLIPIDKSLMRQVIHNLVVNAIRYSPPEKGKAEISLDLKSGYFLLKVKDNGIGIPKDEQDKIFEKFFRANNAIKMVTEGTGLGLYVSKMIVEQAGGKIWFESEENKGTTFFVMLPEKGMKPRRGERGLALS